MRHAGQTLVNRPRNPQRCPRVRARSAGLVESARSRTRENSSAELTRRGWLSARRAGVQTTISGATGREADDKAARGALQARRGSGGDPSSAVRTPIAPPSPPLSHLAPLSLLSTLRARACEPLPLHARASDVARAGTKVAPDLELHAAAARAASQRRRGRLGRGRLIALPLRLSRVAGLLRERHERRATRRRAAGRGGRRRRRRRPRRERRWRHCGGTLRAERGAPQRRACVRRWRATRPQTRRQSAPRPRAPRRPSRARTGGCRTRRMC